MNWYPPGTHVKYCDETLEALKMENEAHGLVAP